MIFDPEILLWKWGLPGCSIRTRSGAVVEWTGCSTAAPPSAAEYAEAAAEYAQAKALSTPLSKVALRRALRARGLEPTLKALLKADRVAADDWADAVTLRLDDPVFAQMLPAFKAQAGLTDADVAALVEAARA